MKRQDAIVWELNDGGFDFIKEGPMGSNFAGYAIRACDTTNKLVLLTADNRQFARVASVQELCERFIPQGWRIFLWTADDGYVQTIRKLKHLPEKGVRN